MLNDRCFLIANCELLEKKYFDKIDFSNASILHFNNAIHRNHFYDYEKNNQYLVLNTHSHGFYNYKNLDTIYHSYNKIIFMVHNEKQLLDPWFTLYNNYNKPKDIWGCDDYISVGTKTIKYISNNFKNTEIHLVGFLGHHTLKNGKVYGKGHNFKKEKLTIKNLIPKTNMHYCDIESFEK